MAKLEDRHNQFAVFRCSYCSEICNDDPKAICYYKVVEQRWEAACGHCFAQFVKYGSLQDMLDWGVYGVSIHRLSLRANIPYLYRMEKPLHKLTREAWDSIEDVADFVASPNLTPQI